MQGGWGRRVRRRVVLAGRSSASFQGFSYNDVYNKYVYLLIVIKSRRVKSSGVIITRSRNLFAVHRFICRRRRRTYIIYIYNVCDEFPRVFFFPQEVLLRSFVFRVRLPAAIIRVSIHPRAFNNSRTINIIPTYATRPIMTCSGRSRPSFERRKCCRRT